MNKLKQLLIAVEDAKESLRQAEHELNAFLKPILTVLGVTDAVVSSCFTDGNILFVTQSGSCRGYAWDRDYKFPQSIFTSDDPLMEAKQYVDAAAVKKELADRKEKLQTIERLQRELA